MSLRPIRWIGRYIWGDVTFYSTVCYINESEFQFCNRVSVGSLSNDGKEVLDP
jgi:hypothetical protein